MFDPNMPPPGAGQMQITSVPQTLGAPAQRGPGAHGGFSGNIGGFQMPAGLNMPQMPQMGGGVQRPQHARPDISAYMTALRGWLDQRPQGGGAEAIQGWFGQMPQRNQVAGQVSPMSVPQGY